VRHSLKDVACQARLPQPSAESTPRILALQDLWLPNCRARSYARKELSSEVRPSRVERSNAREAGCKEKAGCKETRLRAHRLQGNRRAAKYKAAKYGAAK
jgi:hypothetical protein